jgi:hypothetical protein
VVDLIAYIKAGFVPQNAAFKGTGRSGADIGALPVEVHAAPRRSQGLCPLIGGNP